MANLTPERRELLAGLSTEQRYAVKQAFNEWWEYARAAGYEPLKSWANFHAEVDHSALLDRILSGQKPLPEPPPKSGGYPDYAAVDDGLALHPAYARLVGIYKNSRADWAGSAAIRAASETLGMSERAYADARLSANQFSWSATVTSGQITQAHLDHAYAAAGQS